MIRTPPAVDRYFYRLRGLGLSVVAPPWHWLYYLYSSVAFAIGTLLHRLPWETGFKKKPTAARS